MHLSNCHPEYVIVGAGLTGAVIARHLVDSGRSVLIIDRRSHLGGNVHDHTHSSGIRIHTYGPHYFRTSDEKIWSFVNRFAEFFRYEPALKSLIDGRLENWPITDDYIRRTVGPSWKPSFVGKPGNFEEASLSMMPTLVYEKFVKGYSEKQWGVPCTSLSSGLAKRFDVRKDNDVRLVNHTYQGIPTAGYEHLMQNMLRDIPVLLDCDYLTNRSEFKPSRMLVFTGPIDEFFGFDLGYLKYRGQERVHKFIPEVNFAQPCGQVNNPGLSDGDHIRTLEWKHMMPRNQVERIAGTVLTKEIPFTPAVPDQYEYPFPDDINASLYGLYAARAREIPHLLICGRLGEYRYYDMDQAIARAMKLSTRILASTV